jgi:hypothetical protein
MIMLAKRGRGAPEGLERHDMGVAQSDKRGGA